MELTKHGPCLRRPQRRGPPARHRPGAFTDPAALDGRHRRAVTHEHPDHFAPRAAAGGARRRSRRWRCGRTGRWRLSWRGSGAGCTWWAHGDAVTVAGLEVHGARRTARRDPPGDPADRERRVPGRRAGLPPRRCADRAGRAGRDAAAAHARALVEGRPSSSTTCGRCDADQAFAVHDGLLSDVGLGRRRRAAGRAGAGHARRRTAGWPRGTRSSSEARPGPPGNGSADGAAASGRR